MTTHPVEAVRKVVGAIEDIIGSRDREGLLAAVPFVWVAAEEALAAPGLPQVPVACGPGCPGCCRVNVAVLPPEAVAIAAYLEAEFGDDAAALLAKAEDVAARVRWMDHEERVRCAIPCAFLDREGKCLIHPVRPLLCRSMTSTDPEACRRSLEAAAWGEEEPVEMDIARKVVYEEAYTSFAALLERLGLDSRSVELCRGVTAVLKRPELVDDFLQGGRVDWG